MFRASLKFYAAAVAVVSVMLTCDARVALAQSGPTKIATRADIIGHWEQEPFLFLVAFESNGIRYLPGDLLLALIDLRSRQSI